MEIRASGNREALPPWPERAVEEERARVRPVLEWPPSTLVCRTCCRGVAA
ncbi:MAG TPA: hypothetical protein VFK71_00075 [Gaiellaceae bacterium]|nr:hypothetical protein [Gaiellaceae bacterium]